MTHARRRYRVDRMAVSGGEATLNRPWLVAYFQALKALNPDPGARLHLDSNGTLLTPDYIDELVLEAGVTDIGVEPKAVQVGTFQRVTGVADTELAGRYLKAAWRAVEYIATTLRAEPQDEAYADRVFLGVGMPYNRELTSLDEVGAFGRRLAGIDPQVQLCALDYFPTFRRQDLRRPRPSEMLAVKRILEGTGLRTVVVQTAIGHLGPESRDWCLADEISVRLARRFTTKDTKDTKLFSFFFVSWRLGGKMLLFGSGLAGLGDNNPQENPLIPPSRRKIPGFGHPGRAG